MAALALTSTAFEDGGEIPSRYTCDADDIPPHLQIAGVPEGAKSLALVMEDPDVPKEVRSDQLFVHWVLYNMPPDTKDIGPTASVGTHGMNTAGEEGYKGPCPPPQYEPREHRYYFRLYALDVELALGSGASKDELRIAMEGHILDEALLMGRYARQERAT